MSTNLVGKSFEKKVDKKIHNLERNISLVRKKFEDAFKRVDNCYQSILKVIEDSDYNVKIDESLSKIENKRDHINDLYNNFMGGSASIADINELTDRYSDNRLRLIRIATNGESGSGDFLDSSTYYKDESPEFSSSEFVENISFDDLTGLNKDHLRSLISYPGHNRSLFINLFNNPEFTSLNTLKKITPFTKEYDAVKHMSSMPQQSTPFIVIERGNKVHSFDFGIQYITKSDTLKLYIKNGTGGFELKEIGNHSNSAAFVKRFFGSFILEDHGDNIKTSYILNNSEESLFENDLPEFKFRLAHDDKFIFLFLEEVKPYRLTYSTIEKEDGTIYTYIRDILELMFNKNKETTNDDLLISIKNKYGVKNNLFDDEVEEDLKELINILTPFRDEPENIKNIFIVPEYLVNLSLKDNSFFIKNSFVVGQLFGREDILEMPYSYLNVIPNGKSQVQLNNIPLTKGNNIPLKFDNTKFNTNNTIFSTEVGTFTKSKKVVDIVSENDEFIKNSVLENSPVCYHSRVLLSTVLDSGELQRDPDSLPDYIIDEIGMFIPSAENIFYNKIYITYKNFNDGISIENANDLKILNNDTLIPFTFFKEINEGVTINSIVENVLSLKTDNVFKTPYRTSLHILRELFKVHINEDEFKGLIKVTTKILPDRYNFDRVNIKHLSQTDEEFLYGIAPKRFGNDLKLPNQAKYI